MSCAGAKCSPATDFTVRPAGAVLRSGSFEFPLREYIRAGVEAILRFAMFQHDRPRRRPVTPLTWHV